MDYKQHHLKKFFNDRPAIKVATIERICEIPINTIKHFKNGSRNLPEKYFEAVENELQKYGYTSLDSE